MRVYTKQGILENLKKTLNELHPDIILSFLQER